MIDSASVCADAKSDSAPATTLRQIMERSSPNFLSFVSNMSLLDLHAMSLSNALTESASPRHRRKKPQSQSHTGDCINTAHQLLVAADGPVYFVEGVPYTAADLAAEFPEIMIFQLKLEEIFIESEVCPGIWVESSRFIDLRGLAPLRREIKRTKIKCDQNVLLLLQLLLGI